jgi:hypothetical protein
MQKSILSWVAGILSHGFFGSVVPGRDDRLRSCPGWVVAAAALMLVCTFGSAGAECFDYGDYIQRVGGVGTPGSARSVAISETHAYVADSESGLQVIDITNPSSPQIVGSVDTPGYAYGVAISETHAYIADHSSGLHVIDITNPASPQIVGSVDTPDDARSVAISGAHAYVADRQSGLQILPAQCDATSGVEPEIPNLKTHLFEAYPNPFNPHTTIAFEFPKRESVTLRVFDLSGRLVRSLITAELHTPGRHEVVWNGRDDSGRQVASGTYFYRLETGNYSETKRMALIK